MADALTISIPSPLAEDVRAAAEARGMTAEDFVLQQIAFDIALGADDDDYAEDEAISADYDRTGMAIPGEEMAAWLKSIGTDRELPRPVARRVK